MIAVDTNILVYAIREDSSWHKDALNCIRSLAEGDSSWAIPWPCIHEFIAVVTHPRIYKPSTPLQDALLQVDYWMESPGLRLIGESQHYWDHLRNIAIAGKIAGPIVHDARVIAICLAHGVREIWTADRDFSRFKGVTARNPLV
jgi:toxin-antitoxin system PIN domain toxin